METEREKKEFLHEGIFKSTEHCKFKSRKEIDLKLKLHFTSLVPWRQVGA